MFTDLFCRAHINSSNNNIVKLFSCLENLARSHCVIVKILLSVERRVYSKYLFICCRGWLYSFNTRCKLSIHDESEITKQGQDIKK